MNNSLNFTLPSLEAKQYVLDNGLKVYAFENNDMGVIRMEFFFPIAGTASQNKIYSSLLTNTLISEGSKKHSAIEIANHIDYYGAFIEKTLDKETASVCFYFLPKYQDVLMPCFEEIIKEPIFYQSEMDIYISKLRQQYLVNNQKTDYISRVAFNEAIFGAKHPFGVIGSWEDFDLIQREDVIDFYNNFYSLNGASIILAGNINKGFISLLNKSFGNEDLQVKNTPAIKPIPTNIDTQPIKKTIHLAQSVQASIRIGNISISSNNDDFMSLSVLNCLLGGYFGSRLMSNIRQDKGYTYGIGSALYSYRDVGAFYIVADVKAEYCQNAIDEVYKEIETLHTQRVGDKELERVKSYMRGDLLRSLDGSFELANNFRPLLKYELPTDYYNKFLETINYISPEDLIMLSNKYLKIEKMTEIRVGNETIIT